MKCYSRLSIFILPLLLLYGTVSFAARSADRTQMGHDIHVYPGEDTRDVTCFNCSIYFAGRATGDLTAFRGNVVVESGSEVAGDVTAFAGNVTAQSGTQIAGDLTAIAGSVHRQQEAKVAGDVTSLGGVTWMLAIAVPPLLFVGAIVGLIVWLVQRNRGVPGTPVYVHPTGQPSTRA